METQTLVPGSTPAGRGWKKDSRGRGRPAAAIAAPAARPALRRGPIEVRTDGGWTFEVPAPVAIVGLAALFLAALFAAVDPIVVRAAVVDHEASDVLRWENAEHARLGRELAAIENPLRDLRRQALVEGIAPEGDLAPSPCDGTPEQHLAGHLQEASHLAAALAAKGAAGGSASSLPFRSPIDLSNGDYALETARWVVGSVHVSSKMGARNDPFSGEWKDHKGLDIGAPLGTPVLAPGDGTVVWAGSVDPNVDHARSLLGNYIEIKHGTTGVTTIFGHLSKIDVKTGQTVHAGDRIGAVGSTGHSTAPHLHYQVMKAGENVNPLLYITDVVLVQDGKSLVYAKEASK